MMNCDKKLSKCPLPKIGSSDWRWTLSFSEPSKNKDKDFDLELEVTLSDGWKCTYNIESNCVNTYHVMFGEHSTDYRQSIESKVIAEFLPDVSTAKMFCEMHARKTWKEHEALQDKIDHCQWNAGDDVFEVIKRSLQEGSTIVYRPTGEVVGATQTVYFPAPKGSAGANGKLCIWIVFNTNLCPGPMFGVLETQPLAEKFLLATLRSKELHRGTDQG